MNGNVNIKSTKEVYPQIYAYTLPGVEENRGWVKIGYTIRENVEDRIKEQVHTAGLTHKTLWHKDAKYLDNEEYFTDHDFHRYLIKFKGRTRRPGHEWFYYGIGNEDEAYSDFMDFIGNEFTQINRGNIEYTLRTEQENSVNMTMEYIEGGGSEFLWNAKPRFGKTLTTYDLIRRLEYDNVLVVTNRPAIGNSWFDDYSKFIAWQTNYIFVSEADALKNTTALTYNEYKLIDDEDKKMIAFVSLQDLKGAIAFGGDYDKLNWVSDTKWDMLVIDEAHEAVDTLKTDIAFDNLDKDFTLHLSGTPFKAVATGKFSSDQIYNWTYEDEQRAKFNWDYDHGSNPYEKLPVLNLYSYRMGDAVSKKASEGMQVDNVDLSYTFDLNEFFSTNNSGKFVYEDDVIRWLDTLTTNEKYPFSTYELRSELKHTFWLLNRVSSAKALQKLLKKHPSFSNYEVVLAAGDGKLDDSTEAISNKSIERVRDAIENNEYTITLSVGQLTTGVTIPEWTAVLMLLNLSSPSVYMQAAFRSQNPWSYTDEEGNLFEKTNAYIFDFSPNRTLIVYDEFANNLNSLTVNGGGTTEEREENVAELINFLPVIAEDEDGTMKQLNVNEVLTIPKTITANEVVKRGFMSNLLFKNVSRIFNDEKLKEIINKMNGQVGSTNKVDKKDNPIDTGDISLNDDNEVAIDENLVFNVNEDNFGKKVFKDATTEVFKAIDSLDETNSKVIGDTYNELVVDKMKEIGKEHGLTMKQVKKHTDNNSQKVVNEFEKVKAQERIAKNAIEKKYEESKNIAFATNGDLDEVENNYKEELNRNKTQFEEVMKDKLSDVMESAAETTIMEIMREEKEKEKRSVESDVRTKLRGFARTIPTFLMAYGDDTIDLMNFDTILNEDTFVEMTGITIDDFKMLRDEYEFFDETVFNQSIVEFLNKRRELSNYFEYKEEDIFDYIPPQQTNQIYTPKWVASYQLDLLEESEPGVFSDPNRTFCDLYIKSGVYLTEVVKRLFSGLADSMPDEKLRIKHILENQIYGFAPTEVIYNIARNYIFDFIEDSDIMIDDSHIVHLDTLPYARSGDVKSFLNKCKEFYKLKDMDYLIKGDDNELKFDVIVGNPPYNIIKKTTSFDIWQDFISLGTEISDISTFVHPGRWVIPKKTMEKIRDKMMETGLKSFEYFEKSSDVFFGTRIDGGITITLFEKDYTSEVTFKIGGETELKTYSKEDLFLSNVYEEEVFSKISKKVKNKDNMLSLIIGNIGSLGTSEHGYSKKDHIQLLTSNKDEISNPIRVWANQGYGKGSRMGWYYIDRDKINPIPDKITEKRKVLIDKKGVPITLSRGAVFNNLPQIVEKSTIGDSVLFAIPHNDTDYDLNLIKSLFITKTARFLMTIKQKDLCVRGFEMIPDYLELAELLPEGVDTFTDEWFYETFDFSPELINHIEESVSEK